ncbi:hypothetical protein LV476_03660 [Guyparkeria hydrothermalis]|uniref:hypothetical protein n=1 Tax=Guyparkeria hydrothermalis TaxID=923 RepID=UPI0020228239|nr:hypothetical protein [Guyparkeria hydrothermalis]MCL7744049.1 hypothetical protein [Guyparkeria hydrothermalis]
MKAVHFGLRYRHSPALASSFFDPDMPPEWRVAFLLNEQDALWVAGEDPDAETVLEELADAPAPVFVVVESVAWSRDWEAVAQAGYHRVVRLDDNTPVWRPDNEADRAVVGLIPASDDASALRDGLERFVEQAPAEAALFVDGEPPSVTTVDRLKTLAELIGL